MKFNFSHITKSLFLSMCMLLVGIAVSMAKPSYTNTPTTSDSFKEEEAEKNITNVKVMYNPVSEEVSLIFKLASQSVVTVKLMDALGNEVLNFHNGTIDAGSQSMSFETSGKVSSGFYFVKISSGVETVIKRISIRK